MQRASWDEINVFGGGIIHWGSAVGGGSKGDRRYQNRFKTSLMPEEALLFHFI